TRTIAEVTRALARLDRSHARLPLLTQALVTLGRDDGWGTTNANAAALLALTDVLQTSAGPARSATVRLDGAAKPLTIGGATPVVSLSGTTGQAVEVSVT